MASQLTTGSTRVQLSADDVERQQKTGALVLDSRRRRPLYFDGRFLAARDLVREQEYFLMRQADLARSAGFGVVHGLQVSELVNSQGQRVADGLRVLAGHGITPSGELVLVPNDLQIHLSDLEEEQKLDVNFGLANQPVSPARTRSGLFVVALRPVEFTANPIASYPTSIQGNRQTHDGDIVEATAICLVPYPSTASSYEPEQRRAAVAAEIFGGADRSRSTLNASLLPLAIVSMKRGNVEWVDGWLVRREVSADNGGQRLGLTDRATRSAFFLQYDAQLQGILAARRAATLNGNFAASQYFRLLPPAGRFPMESIDTRDFKQSFFPSHLDVRLSIVPVDEIPALIEESKELPPLDLTLSADAYDQLSVFALLPVARDQFAALRGKLQPATLAPSLPQSLAFRRPLELLRLYRAQRAPLTQPSVNASPADWTAAVGQSAFGIFLRRKSAPQFVDFTGA